VGVSIVSAILEGAVTFSDCFDRRLARPAAVEPHIRARDAEGVIDAAPKLFKALLLDIDIDVADFVGPKSSLHTPGAVLGPAGYGRASPAGGHLMGFAYCAQS